MKALTVRQPYAQLIARGAKTIETRSRPTRHRGWLAIHAAKTNPGEGELGGFMFACGPEGGWLGEIQGRDSYTGTPFPELVLDVLHLGAVVAVANLVDCVPIVDRDDMSPERPPIINRGASGLTLWTGTSWDKDRKPVDLTDQWPYGDFTPGRWAWLLEDVRALATPVPTRGRQGLWDLPGEVAADREARVARKTAVAR